MVVSKERLQVVRLHSDAKLPSYGSCGAAGADLYACLEEPLTIEPGQSGWVPTGIALEIPEGYAGLIYARSGLACKYGLAPANKVGVVDSDYRGQVMVVLHNHSSEERVISHGDRIAQLLITPVLTPDFVFADTLSASERDDGGFGSTGI